MAWLLGGVVGGSTAYILGQLGVDIIGQYLGAAIGGIVIGILAS